MLRIDEPLPSGALESEVVLHVRLHLRRNIRSGASSAAADLALLFGFPPSAGDEKAWQKAAASSAWLQAGAEVAAREWKITDGVVPLGHDADHVLRCKEWLRSRKDLDQAFAATVATDLATLLELSRARDLAIAEGMDDDNEPRPLPILIQGLTGTGKELLAKGIHQIGWKAKGREQAPFEVVQVAGMTDEFLNDELFGHVKGAFTDAKEARRGRLEAANGGTLFIDEVGDLPPAAQLRLLRFLQTQRISRLGENREQKVYVRVIAATWHDLDKDVEAGRFREDLLYRLRVGSGLVLRPLLEREGIFDEVVPELLRRRGHAARPLMMRSARDALAHQEWSGNLRDLVHVLEAAVSLASGEPLRLEHLQPHIQRTYLALPLHARGTGFLADEHDGQELTEELMHWRVAQINKSLDALPPPAPNPELNQIGEFLTLLEDPSPEHQRSVQEVRELLSLDQQRRRHLELAKVWSQIIGSGLPALVERVVREVEDQENLRAQELGEQLKRLQGTTQLDQNPWLKLFREVQGLPLLRHANAGDLAKFFWGAFNFLRLVAPAAIDTIREDIRTGGIDRLRSRAVAFIQEQNAAPIPAEAQASPVMPRMPLPSSLSRKEWIEVTRQYATLSDATADTGYDPKTIVKYLSKFKIKNPWASSQRKKA